jgi:heme exporter protein C
MQTLSIKPRKGYLGALALLVIASGFYWGLIKAPPDAYQGDAQRIMYLHIPSILTAYLSFFLVFVGSCLYLWKREKRDDILAYSAAEIGVLFTALTIAEGSIWGQTHLGRLVDLGRALNLHSGFAFNLYRLSHAAFSH